ncbi:unnamed protein product [Closterium sp. Naga37s-1]|nr:unnamed protein product [Closterium sp. Naga37s-1]
MGAAMHVRHPSLPRQDDAVAWELQRLERDESDAFSRLRSSLPPSYSLLPPASHPLPPMALRAIQILPRGMSVDTSAPTPESVDQILSHALSAPFIPLLPPTSYLDHIQALLTGDHLKAKLLFALLTLSPVHGQADNFTIPTPTSYLDDIQPLLTSDHLKAKLLFARLTLSLVHGQADAALLLAFLSLIQNGPYGVFPTARYKQEIHLQQQE